MRTPTKKELKAEITSLNFTIEKKNAIIADQRRRLDEHYKFVKNGKATLEHLVKVNEDMAKRIASLEAARWNYKTTINILVHMMEESALHIRSSTDYRASFPAPKKITINPDGTYTEKNNG